MCIYVHTKVQKGWKEMDGTDNSGHLWDLGDA